MRSSHLRLGAVAVVAALLAACSRDLTAPAAANNGISARGVSTSSGGVGGGGGSTGGSYTGVIDSTANVNVGTYYVSYLTVWYSGSHAFRATSTTKVLRLMS